MLQFLRNRIWLLPSGLFVLNLLVKALYISFAGVALDEPFSIFYAQWDLIPMVRFLFSGNNPPLFEVLLHFWIRWFGTGAPAVRFLPLVFSSLTSVYVFLLGRKVSGTATGLTAGLLYTFSSFHIYFAHEARVYSLFTLLSTASLYYYFSLEDKSSRRPFLLFVACNVLLAFSHYFGIIVILAQLLFSLFFLKTHPFSFRKIWLSFILLLALISPLILIIPGRIKQVLQEGGTWVSKPPLDAWYENIRKFSNEPVVAVLFLMVAVTGTAWMIARKRFRAQLEMRVLVLWFTGIYTSLFLFSFLLPVFVDRYLVFLSVPFYVLVAACVQEPGRGRNWELAGPVICCATMLFTVNLHPGNERAPREMAGYVLSKKGPSTVVFIAPEWADKGVMYYCDRSVFEDPLHFTERMQAASWFPVFNPDQAMGKIPPGTKQIIYIEQGVFHVKEEGSAFRKADFPYVLREEKQFDKADRVTLFQLKTDLPQ